MTDPHKSMLDLSTGDDTPTSRPAEYKLPSYPKVQALGHRLIANIFKGPVVVQEKTDGSQFTFGKVRGEIFCRTRGQQLVLGAPEKMFAAAVEQVLARAGSLNEGWVYRAEYLEKPKHNTLAYGRTPIGNLVLFDAHPDASGHGVLNPEDLRLEAERLGLEPVPVLFEGVVHDMAQLEALLDTDSVLGGVKVEGIVVKNYDQFTPDGHYCTGKLVSAAFKEKHQGEWKRTNPSAKDVVQTLISELRHERRWGKGVEHMRDAGQLTDTPKDIGPLIKAIQADIKEEEGDHIREVLFSHFWPTIKRGIIAGLPEWYKEQVAVYAFGPSTDTTDESCGQPSE